MAFRIKRKVFSVAIANGQTIGNSTAQALNGRLVGITSSVPDLDGAVTLTLTVLDAEGVTVFTKAAIAKNAVYSQFIDANNHPLKLPLSGNHTVRATASGVQSGDNDTVPVTLLIEE